MTIAKGTRLGPYELATLVGEGGMGQVYRARDTRLDRTVAIKVLSARFGDSPDRRARFEREARLISSLSHPNICALFDVGREGETDFLVMEYLEGETLASRLARGPLALDMVLRFASQIAAAIERAHRQGIVHRDLKPGNILVTPSGVKVLDFGLAKIQAAPATGSWPEALPTKTTDAWPAPALTVEGTVLGTPHYMAPEQFEGLEVDARADLWAFGCVLYEMATGSRPFAGSGSASIAAAVLRSEPERPSIRQAGCPPALERLILGCLVKDREQRWQSALDARLELDGMLAGGAEAIATTATGPRRWLPWVAALVLAAAGTGAAAWLGRRGAAPPPRTAVRFEVAPPAGMAFLAPSVEVIPFAVSPDGGRIAYVLIEGQGRRVWQRRVDELDARPIAGTEGASSIFWSPDGRSLAFFGSGKLRRIDLEGGSPVPICDLSAGIGYSGTWSPAGTILFSSVQGNAIYAVPASGGVPKRVLEPDTARHEGRLVWPQFLPDGSGFLYSSRSAEGFSLMFVDGDAPPRVVAHLASRAGFVAPDWLVFARDGALLAQHFNRATGQLTGAAESIAPTVRVFVSSAWAGFAASPGGSLFFLTGQTSSRLVWLDRSGTPQGTAGMPGDYLTVSVAPDGRSLLADRAQKELGTHDIWKVDLDRDLETRITSDPEADFEPVWLPGTRSMVYSRVSGSGSPNMWRRDLDTGLEELLLPRPEFESATDASQDGRLLAFVQRGVAGKFHGWILDLGGQHQATPLLQTDAQVASVRFSPDARYVAFISDESGGDEAYVAPLAHPHDAIRISPHGASLLRWRRDGREILFLGGDRTMTAVSVRTEPRLELGPPERLFVLPGDVDWNDFDVTSDGRRLIAIRIDRRASTQPATAIVGWTPGAAP